VERYLNRKAFVTTLGAAGLGLSMTVASLGGAPAALAQDEGTESPAADVLVEFDHDALRAEFYAAFTAALGDELAISEDEVDAVIRTALATVVDGLAGDDVLTPGQATAVKALVASLEVPVGPGPLFGHGPGMFQRAVAAEHGPDFPGERIAIIAGDEAAEGPRALAADFYPAFTAALADELGAGSADDVDGAIRLAMMTAIDEVVDSGTLPIPIPADALKAMVATAESPLAPGLLFGPPPGLMVHAFHARGEDGPAFIGRGGAEGPFKERIEQGRAGEGIESDSRGDEDATEDDAAVSEDEEDDGSS
jgi:hypothetical protein